MSKTCYMCGWHVSMEIEDCPIQVCHVCATEFWTTARLRDLIKTAFQAGRKSVLGDLSDADDADGESSKVL